MLSPHATSFQCFNVTLISVYSEQLACIKAKIADCIWTGNPTREQRENLRFVYLNSQIRLVTRCCRLELITALFLIRYGFSSRFSFSGKLHMYDKQIGISEKFMIGVFSVHLSLLHNKLIFFYLLTSKEYESNISANRNNLIQSRHVFF